MSIQLFPGYNNAVVPTMVFVDGENLAIRFGAQLEQSGNKQIKQVSFRKDVYVWSSFLNTSLKFRAHTIRKHYYTALTGSQQTLEETIDDLKDAGVEHPSVFLKRSGRSKQVDITLATDMLLHATRKNYDTAILVAGDGDYVPLVNAVKSLGCRVIVWFFQNGISPELRRASDYFVDISEFFFNENASAY